MTTQKKQIRRNTGPAKARKPKPRAYPQPMVPPALVRQVCGLSDPFCSHALNAKLPDNAGIRSLTYPVHSRTTMTTDANGNAALLLLPNYLYEPLNVGTVNVGATNVLYGSAQTVASRLGSPNSYRITSFGVKLRRISAPLSSSGMLHIRGFASVDGASLVNVHPTTYNSDFSEDIALQDCKEIAVLGKRSDPKSKFFTISTTTTPTAAVADWVSPGWGTTQLVIVGGPASTGVIDVELFFNMEVTFNDNESMQLLATPAPKANSVVTEAVDEVASEAKSVFVEGAKEVAKWTIRQAGRALVTAIGTKIGGPKMGVQALALTLD